MSLDQKIRLGGGSAFFNDRLDAALELVEKGDIDVLMIETLAERTLALLHAAKRAGGSGYWDKLADRLLEIIYAMFSAGERNKLMLANKAIGRLERRRQIAIR